MCEFERSYLSYLLLLKAEASQDMWVSKIIPLTLKRSSPVKMCELERSYLLLLKEVALSRRVSWRDRTSYS